MKDDNLLNYGLREKGHLNMSGKGCSRFMKSETVYRSGLRFPILKNALQLIESIAQFGNEEFPIQETNC